MNYRQRTSLSDAMYRSKRREKNTVGIGKVGKDMYKCRNVTKNWSFIICGVYIYMKKDMMMDSGLRFEHSS